MHSCTHEAAFHRSNAGALVRHYMLQAAGVAVSSTCGSPYYCNLTSVCLTWHLHLGRGGNNYTWLRSLACKKNIGIIFADDSNAALQARTKSLRLTANVHRVGREFPKVMGGFDRVTVLLDAPCRGMGGG
jgi:hypothetical protein